MINLILLFISIKNPPLKTKKTLKEIEKDWLADFISILLVSQSHEEQSNSDVFSEAWGSFL